MRSGGQDFSRHPDVLEVTDEAARRPTSKPFSVSPCARPPGPTFGCRTPRARGGPPRTSAPTTHPAPTRPGARRTRAAPGAGRPNGPGARRTRAALGVGLSWRTRWRMKPRASQPQNHSPCPRASPRSVLTGRRPGPRSGRCRTPRARGGPPRTSAPTTHPAPTRPGARSTRAALGAGLSSGGDFTLRTVSERGAGMVKKRE